MRKLYFLVGLLIIFSCFSSHAQILWSEDFETEASNSTSGTATGTPGGTWYVITPPSGGTFSLQGNAFEINNTGNEGVWSTNAIDISSYGYAVIDIYLAIEILWGGSASDYIQCYYSVDGGPEILFGEVRASFLEFSGSTNGSAIVAGNSLRLIVRANDESTIGTVSFDNATITGVDKLYSRKNGNWNDVTAGNSTWSTDDFTISPQTSCSCLPNNNTVAIIGNGNTVNMNVDGTSGGVEIESSGSLLYTNANVDLNVSRGFLTVDGSTDHNGMDNARINFTGDVVSFADINGSLSLDDFSLSSAGTVNFTGTGSVTLVDELRFGDDGGALNNGLPFSFVTLNSNNNDVTVNNQSTFNQSGGFSNVGGSSFNNLSGAIWNYEFGTAPPANLNCSPSNNTFNYSATGNQTVRGMQYYHLIFSGSGTKTTNAPLNVNGDLTISDAARLDVNAGNDNINLAGNWIVTSTNGNSFVEGTRTVTFDGAGTQYISKSTGQETFYNLIINTSTITNEVSLLNDITVTRVLNLTRGRLNLNNNALNVTLNIAAAITGGDADSYIISETTTAPYGRIIWTTGSTNATFTFPFGTTNGDYIPFTFNKTAGTAAAGTFSVATYPTGDNNIPYPSGVTHVFDASGADNSANVVNRFWILTPTGYPANQPTATLTFMVAAAEASGVATLRAQRWNSGADQWDAALTGQTNPAPGTRSARVPNVTTYSPWTLSALLAPLPVELTHFAATINNDAVDLHWTTATELNNDFFTVERAIDPEHFEPLARIPGH